MKFETYLSLKYIAEEKDNLEEVARVVREQAQHLGAMAVDGVVLVCPVDNGVLCLGTDDETIAAKYELEETEGDDLEIG